jgi:cell division protein FtsX
VEIAPSSGFVNSVMDAVRSDAAGPPPIPFPWKYALPGLAGSIGAIVWLLLQVRRLPVSDAAAPTFTPNFSAHLVSWLQTLQMAGVTWILLAVLAMWAGIRLSLILARR